MLKWLKKFLHKNTHHTILCKKNCLFFKNTFSISSATSAFISLRGWRCLIVLNGVLYTYQIPNEITLLRMDYEVSLGQKKIKAERSKWFHCKTSRFLFFSDKLLKKLRKNYSKFVWLSGKIINVIQSSASKCMKSSLIICPKSAKVTWKQCTGAISISLFCQIKLFKVIYLLFIGYFTCLLNLSFHQCFQ